MVIKTWKWGKKRKKQTELAPGNSFYDWSFALRDESAVTDITSVPTLIQKALLRFVFALLGWTDKNRGLQRAHVNISNLTDPLCVLAFQTHVTLEARGPHPGTTSSDSVLTSAAVYVKKLSFNKSLHKIWQQKKCMSNFLYNKNLWF